MSGLGSRQPLRRLRPRPFKAAAGCRENRHGTCYHRRACELSFNASREQSTTIDPRFYQVTERRRSERGVLLSANWSFGRSPKERDRDENDQSGDA